MKKLWYLTGCIIMKNVAKIEKCENRISHKIGAASEKKGAWQHDEQKREKGLLKNPLNGWNFEMASW